MEEDADSVFINFKELSQIYHLDLTASSQFEKYKDQFVLDCSLASDSVIIRLSNQIRSRNEMKKQ